MQAFFNDPALKDRLLVELAKHKAADAIIQGSYGNPDLPLPQFRGCAVGCTLHSLGAENVDDHSEYPRLLGIPESLARLQDRIFESLPADEARELARSIR